ncbi:MAG: hypothetical protein J6B29_02235 [Clostridia bacterium]|nr:hypothetical protein [Clostridia bacterium]
MEKLDIKSSYPYPSNMLSNFYPHSFAIDGIECGSMEGFLQSLKHRSKEKQIKICKLHGIEAKSKGKFKILWKLTGNVYWQGKKIKRKSEDFSALILRAYCELFKNEDFKKALIDSIDYELTHTIGSHDKRKTVLTEEEFLFCLNYLRKILNRQTN